MRTTSLLAPLLAAALAAAVPARPKLVVVISVDQFSAELMSRWCQDMPGGLGRLHREGTAFLDAYQDHGYTETGPGHSVILTGRHPMHTGITYNTWLDRTTHRTTYCVEDPKGTPLAGHATPVGPAHLDATPLGEWLTTQVKGSRSFAVTGKDRSAILMAGHKAQGVYWFGGAEGFTTTAAYASTLPAWLTTYNVQLMDRLRDQSLYWTALDERGMPPAATYSLHGQAVTMALPRAIHAVGMPMDTAFWARFRATPFFDVAIFGAARALMDAEHLGEGPATDLLALGLSATDYVGHRYGNGGPEMMDQLRRLDRELGRFLDQLQAKVPGGLWVVLTADHGAADCPERLQAQGIPARRIVPRTLGESLNRELAKRLGGKRDYLLPMDGPQVYLNPEALAENGHTRAEILATLLPLLKGNPDVAEACTAEELSACTPDPQEAPTHRSLKTMLRLSFVESRSGDVLLAFKPFLFIDDPKDALSHGLPQDYDRRVPLIFWGPWKAERRTEPVRIIDLAPTLAKELRIETPNQVDGRPLLLKIKE